MSAIRRPAWNTPAIVSVSLVTSILSHSLPAVGQTDVLVYEGTKVGIGASAARGIAERGWEPLTMVGTVEGTTQNAACWIRVSSAWTEHVLPGLVATGASWANAVDHVPASQGGEWTLVVGAAMDASGAQRPMQWQNVTNTQWQGQPLPTAAGVIGEALGLFVPNGIPLRAFVCGWASEIPPTSQASQARPSVSHHRGATVWSLKSWSAQIIYLEFGAGLESVANDIASSEVGTLIAVGGGQNVAGQWRPQLWKSMDDGQTWSNEEMPLPLGVSTGEATDWDHEVGHWQGAGWGVSTAGRTVPLLWELVTDTALLSWIVHELPLPPLDDGGVNASVHKLPGRVKYANIVLKQGINPEAGIWIDSPAGSWTLVEPADYLVNPEIGMPVAPAGLDKLGRVAVKFTNPPTTTGANASGVTNTFAGLLTPEPLTGIDDGGSAPRLIAVTASPNPFNSGVRIGYTVPWDAFVKVTIHDVAGRVVTHLDQGRLQAGEERVVRWNGLARNGQRAAAGVYFVRVETPYENATVKIVRVD